MILHPHFAKKMLDAGIIVLFKKTGIAYFYVFKLASTQLANNPIY